MRVWMKSIAVGLALFGIAGFALPVWADDDAPTGTVTFTKDVLPILQENCQTCHRPAGINLSGMIAPMALMEYKDVRPWAKSIAQAVEGRTMPPWHATPETSHRFSNSRLLSGNEIATLVKWAKTGARMGNPGDAPPAREFPNDDGWAIGKPDLIIEFDEPYFVGDDVKDHYENIRVTLTEEMLPEERWIKALEFKPGSQVVHHIIAYGMSPEMGEGRPERGMLGGMAPGTDPARYPEGYGLLLKPGTTVVFAMHYHKEAGPGTGEFDSSQMGLKFHDGPVKHKLRVDSISYGRFEIPPHHGNWEVGMARTFKTDTTVIDLMPHMHIRGKAAKYVAFYPDGTEEVLLDVPVYDFNWQTSYEFKEPKLLPAGTRVEVQMWFDNSADRAAFTEINPSRTIRFGGPTTDEMDLGWITYSTGGTEE